MTSLDRARCANHTNPAARSSRLTEFLLAELVDRYRAAAASASGHPIALVGALILDFLAIHPVADGNGRLVRLLTTHVLLEQGYGVTRYASVEQRIYESRNAYYAALYESQRDWHDARHDVWPWIGYLVGILAAAYDDFEARVAAKRDLSGISKQERVRRYVLHHAPRTFRTRDVRGALPGVSDPTIRLVLAELRDAGLITIDEVSGGHGPQAAWRRLDQPSLSDSEPRRCRC